VDYIGGAWQDSHPVDETGPGLDDGSPFFIGTFGILRHSKTSQCGRRTNPSATASPAPATQDLGRPDLKP